MNNIYFINAGERNFAEFSEDGYTLYIEQPCVDYVAASTPGKAKALFIAAKKTDGYSHIEYTDKMSIVKLGTTSYDTGVIGSLYHDPNFAYKSEWNERGLEQFMPDGIDAEIELTYSPKNPALHCWTANISGYSGAHDKSAKEAIAWAVINFIGYEYELWGEPQTLNTADKTTRHEYEQWAEKEVAYVDVISRTCEACDQTKDYAMCQTCGCCHGHCECGLTQRQQTLKLSPAQLKMLRKLNYEGDLSIYEVGRYQHPTLLALYRRGYAGMGIFDSGQYVWRITSKGQQVLSKQELTNIVLSNSTLTALFAKRS